MEMTEWKGLLAAEFQTCSRDFVDMAHVADDTMYGLTRNRWWRVEKWFWRVKGWDGMDGEVEGLRSEFPLLLVLGFAVT